VAVSGLESGVAAIAAGWNHTCALTTAGAVVCWGYNGSGQLGDGTATGRSTPTPVSGLGSGVVAITASEGHTCAVTTGGGVACWGRNERGQLGDGTTTNRLIPTAVNGLGSGVAEVSAGRWHSCALTTAGAVVCWGYNGSGQLGDGTTTQRLTPTAVNGASSGVAAIAAGHYHSCALATGGGILCWGSNGEGELGDGTTTNRSTPTAVSGLGSGVAAIAAGNGFTCALTTGGGVLCWGWNGEGELGDGTTTRRLTPTPVSGLGNGVAAIATGAVHTCAVTTTGSVACWGWNGIGQLGDGRAIQHPTPTAVSGLSSGVAALKAGQDHTCALTTGGGALCWGDNWFGQLGDGTTTIRSTPTAVSGLGSGVAAIAAGDYHTCALTTGGGVLCWGWNGEGQLGDGTTTNRSTPVAVSGLGSGVAAIAAGGNHTCAVTTSGGALCWGRNGSGQLGDGTTTNRLTPTLVSGLGSGVAAIAAGSQHTCALTTSGGVVCWGSNSSGQLGDGTTTPRATPTPVNELGSSVAAIAAGGSHTCAVTTGGSVVCWGGNGIGQLGDGTTTNRLIPTAVSGLGAGVAAIAAGVAHTCAVTTGGAVLCWGARTWAERAGT
jgi:alpha-tubulin suppressor-like RCC1 family protein